MLRHAMGEPHVGMHLESLAVGIALCRDPSIRHLDREKRIWRVEIWVDGWWTGKKIKEQKVFQKDIYC